MLLQSIYLLQQKWQLINKIYNILIINLKRQKQLSYYCRMSKIKHFQISIESVIGVNVDSLNFAATLVQIKQKNGKVLKITPLNQISQVTLQVGQIDKIILIFSLLESSAQGFRDPKVFAEGIISISCKQVGYKQKFNIGCPIRNLIDKKAVLTLVIRIKQDQERLAYQIPDSESSRVSQHQSDFKQKSEPKPNPEPSQYSSSQSEQINSLSKKENKNSPKKIQPQKTKSISPNRRSLKKPLRTRHYEYSIKNQSSNMELTNKITDQYRIYLENFRFEIDDPISSIEFYAKNYQQLLAQVFFKTNPSDKQLKELRIKVPEDERKIEIHLKTLQGEKLQGSTDLPQLNENQSLKIECQFKDQNDQIKGNMKFNYKQVPEDIEKKPQRMQLAQQISLFEKKNRAKQQINFIPFLFSDLRQKPNNQEASKLKLPKIFQKQPYIISHSFNQKLIPYRQSQMRKNQSKISKIQKSSKTQKRDIKINEAIYIKNPDLGVFYNNQTVPNKTNNYQVNNRNFSYSKNNRSQLDFIPQKKYSRDSYIRDQKQLNVFSARPENYSQQQNIYQKNGNILLKNRNRILTQPIITSQNSSKSRIKVLSVSVKFYKQYLQKNNHLQYKSTGKFLQIYSNFKNIFRSQAVFTDKILSWQLKLCQLSMNQYDNINFQLNLQKQNTLLGQLIISYNQLKYNQQQNSLYFGYLTKKNEIIGKIHIQYQIHNQMVRDRMSTLQVTSRRLRPRKLFSQDLALNQSQFSHYHKVNPNKLNIYESSVPLIPEEDYKKDSKRPCERQKQLELIKQNKRSRMFSLPRSSKYY